jgi:hypothetical protein
MMHLRPSSILIVYIERHTRWNEPVLLTFHRNLFAMRSSSSSRPTPRPALRAALNGDDAEAERGCGDHIILGESVPHRSTWSSFSTRSG